MNDSTTSNTLIPHLLEATQVLASKVQLKFIPYLNDFFPIILQCMQDTSYSAKREMAVKTMTQIIKSTGFVIAPYYKYPYLMELLLQFMRTESNANIRREMLRLLGALGALDAFYYKKLKNKIHEGLGRSSEENITSHFKASFSILKYLKDTKQVLDKPLTELHKFYDEILVMYNLNRRKISSELNKEKTITFFGDTVDKFVNQNILSNTKQTEDIELLLNAPDQINLGNIDYYSIVAIKTILKVLYLQQYHDLSLGALSFILNSLRSRSANFMYLIMPVFTQLIQIPDNSLRENILLNIEKILGLCGDKFQEEFVDNVIQIVLMNIDATELKLIMKCFEILNALLINCRNHLKHKMEIIVTKLNQILIELEAHRTIIVSVIKLFNNSGDLIDSHLSNIISLLSRMVQQNPTFQEKEVIIQMITFFNVVINTCGSTIKFCSKIVQSLFFIIDHYPDAHQVVVDTFILMLYKYRDIFLVYLPLINIRISKYRIHHEKYRECLTVLLNDGNLDACFQTLEYDLQEMRYSTDSQFSTKVGRNIRDSLTKSTVYSDSANRPPPALTIRKDVDFNSLLKEFRTQGKELKEDWQEWYRKSSLELLKQNPYPVLYGCSSFAGVFDLIAKELYNVSFVSCWSILPSDRREQMTKILATAISSPKIPVNILQRILSLFEFLEHDRIRLQIDINDLGDLAEKCQAYAKALYYREQEFEEDPSNSINNLISLYSSLGQSDAAKGMLVYAKKHLNMEPKMSWYVDLQQWEEALQEFEKIKEDTELSDEMLINKMKCLYNLSEWETLLEDCEKTLKVNNFSDDEKKKQLVSMAADAALHLNDWQKFEVYAEKSDQSIDDKNFLSALVSLKHGKLEEARQAIIKSREVLDTRVMGLLLESYNRGYDTVLKLQQLLEMEEIIEYKEAERKILNENSNFIRARKQLNEDDEEAFNRQSIVFKIEDEPQFEGANVKLANLKQNLINKWNDRINGCQRTVDVWQKILSVRSILLDKAENLDSWIRLIHLCRKSNQEHTLKLAKRTLKQIEADIKARGVDESKFPPKLVLTSLECEHLCDERPLSETIDKIKAYLKLDTWKDNNLKSKYYYKLGKLSRLLYNDRVFDSMPSELEFYNKSIEYNDKNYKTWHSFGYIHFEAIEYFESKNLKNENLIQNVKAALKGFIKAISLGGTQSSTSRTLQDLLRLLTLWFNHGDNDEVQMELQEGFTTIEIISWIEVVPQLMARFDIPKVKIQRSIHDLLIRIGKHHPQALVYPLTVANNDKNMGRRGAAREILKEIEQHSKSLIDQAVVLAEELNRAAIVLKEQWCDGIERASQNYFQEHSIEQAIKTFDELHDLMMKKLETLSEISFHQSFRLEIDEARQWIKRYKSTKELTCMNQAWEIYSTIFHKIKDKLTNITTVYLENVSPKLLQFKDGEISVPGMYRPNKPVIAISGFAPKLPVLASKQHPRKLFVYGSDGKEYTFLLKGKEDLRQDERVMQLFSLCNKLLTSEPETSKKDLSLTRYSIIPLSQGAGLCGWVQNCDTLQALIQEYREGAKISMRVERQLYGNFCAKFDVLPVANKLEVYRNVIENTRGEDLKKILWLKSPNSETWLERRITFTKSLATMSMVGYILGLGDRHPGNIMMQRQTGQIVHIDFGDCFETAMKREKFPERVPFRLTRMLVNSMEAASIEGTFTNTCDSVMSVLRMNKESLIAILQAFVYDPLLNWRLLTDADENIQATTSAQGDQHYSTYASGGLQVPLKAVERGMMIEEAKESELDEPVNYRKISVRKSTKENSKEIKLEPEEENGEEKKEELEKDKKILYESRHAFDQLRAKKARMAEDAKIRPEILNRKALEVIERIKNKLAGRDFSKDESLDVEDQVRKLIRQARSDENIGQSYIGWCPFW